MTLTLADTAALLALDSRAVHAGREDLAGLGVHALPLDLSTTNPLPDVEAGGAAYEWLAGGASLRPEDSAVYARLWNPTVGRFERALAELEDTAQAVAFSSGMAALTATLVSLLPTGRTHVVAVRPLYGGSDHLLATGLLGTSVTFARPEEVRGSLRPDTGLVLLETPANPSLDLVDIADVVEAADGVPVMVDNTFATPVLQQPAALGATYVLHSATKFLGGHGDAVGGVVATDDEHAAALRRVRAITGAILHPLAAYLFHRGIATLPVRVRSQQQTAQLVAAWMQQQPDIARVLHPSVPGCDPQGLVGRQMSGPGSVLAFELSGGYEQAARVATGVRLITHAVSLGGVDSLIQHPASLTHRPLPPDARPTPGLLRLSVGLEDASDLTADLAAALADSRP